MVHGFINDAEKMKDFKELTKEEFLQSYSYITDEATKKQKWIYYYDIWDGCKGIIIADNYEEARKIFKEEFGDNIPIYDEYDLEEYDSGVCSISSVGIYEGKSDLYVTE